MLPVFYILLESCLCLSESPRLSACSRKWVKMNDNNYQRALDHYEDCLALGQSLHLPARDKYQSNVITNMKKTCNYFFERSNLPTSTLIGVVREVARIVEGLDDNIISQTRSGKKKVASHSKSSGRSRKENGSRAEIQDVEEVDRMCNNCIDSTTSCSSSTLQSIITPKTLLSLTSYRRTRLILWALFWLLLFSIVVQLLFIVWLICICLCLGCSGCGTAPSCSCEEGIEPSHDQEIYHMAEAQAELSSLSSDNLGSDSEFEILLKKTTLPTSSNRPFIPKQPE